MLDREGICLIEDEMSGWGAAGGGGDRRRERKRGEEGGGRGRGEGGMALRRTVSPGL